MTWRTLPIPTKRLHELLAHKLLSSVNKTHAIVMVMLAAVSVPISLVNLLNKFAILTLVSKANYLSAFEPEQLNAQVMFYLDSYNSGIQIASIFWGLWLFPFGYLVFKSGFLPKIIGILLMFGCFGYLINFVGNFLFPTSGETLIFSGITNPGSFVVLGAGCRLLLMGVETQNNN